MGIVKPHALKPSNWLRLFQCFTLFGVLAPPVYIAFIDELPVTAELLLLLFTILGFIGAVLWMYSLKTWHVVFPMMLAFALFPFALLSYGGIAKKFELDAVRNKVLAQLGSDSNFIVRRDDYDLPGIDPSANWEIELQQTLPAPVLGWGPELIEPAIDFSLVEVSEAWYSHADIAHRLAGVPGITDSSGFRIYSADTHYSSVCSAPGHCDVELTFSPDSKVLLLHVNNF